MADPRDPILRERLPGESRRAYQALVDYFLMGVDRSLRKLLDRYIQQASSNPPAEKPPTTKFFTLTTWSNKNRWVAAVEAVEVERSRRLSEAQDQALSDQLEYWRGTTMGADEVLSRISEQGRASLADFLRQTNIHLPPARGGEPEVVIASAEVDWEMVRTHGHLLKKLAFNQYGPVLELRDGSPALEAIAKHHQLLVDRHELTGKDGGPIEVEDARANILRKLAGVATAGNSAAIPGDPDRR
jgi:hypothetical protein